MGRDRVSPDRGWDGVIGDVIAYRADLSTYEDSLINIYYIKKYAPPVNLGYNMKIPYGFCDTILDAGSRFTDYVWSTGNIEDTLSTLSVNQTGHYSVTVTDIFGFESVDTIMVYYPEVNQLTDSLICYGNTIKWDTGLNHYYDFDWQDSSTDSIISIFSAGEYYVEITDTFGCVFDSDTVNITIDNYSITTSLGADEELCAGQSLYLETGAAETVEYLWSTNATENHIVIETAGDYWVTATNTIGCIAKDTINIQIQGYAPLPGFYIEEHCLGDLTQFTDTSQVVGIATIVGWQWDFGDLATSNIQNPTHTYADTGTYQVTLHITTDNSCENTLIKDVKIYSNPKAHFSTNQLCQNYLINFINTSTSAMGDIDYSRWDFGDNDTTNEYSTQHIFDTEGAKGIQLRVRTIDGCESVFDTILNIKPSPIADFSHTALCVGENTSFTDETEVSGVLSVFSWLWETSNSDISTQTNPSFNFSNSEYVQVSLQVGSINGCSDTITKNLFVYNKPSVYYTVENACLGSLINIENFSSDNQSSITNYYWWLNGELISQLETPLYSVQDTGIQEMKLKVLSLSGCANILTKSFNAYSLPNSLFTVSEEYTTPLVSVEFNADSINDEFVYEYQFGDQNSQNQPQVSHTYLTDGYYDSKLIVNNQYLCSDSSVVTIRVVQPQLDLAISQLETIDAEGKTRISVLLSNIGNLTINDIDFRIEMSKQTVVEERYSEALYIGESHEIELNTQFLFDSKNAHYLCLTAQVNSAIYDDINLDNNIECLSYKVEDHLLKIYPNPAKDNITIMYRSEKEEDLEYKIIDALGKSIFSGKIEIKEDIHKYNISVAHLAEGMYMLKIKDSLRKFSKE